MKKTSVTNEVLELLVKEIGQELVSALTLRFGGRRIPIPRSSKAVMAQELCKVIGVDGLQKLIKVFGGQEIYLKKDHARTQAVRDRAICDRVDFLMRDVASGGEGLSFRRAILKLVDEFGLSDRRIEVIVNRGCK